MPTPWSNDDEKPGGDMPVPCSMILFGFFGFGAAIAALLVKVLV